MPIDRACTFPGSLFSVVSALSLAMRIYRANYMEPLSTFLERYFFATDQALQSRRPHDHTYSRSNFTWADCNQRRAAPPRTNVFLFIEFSPDIAAF